MRWADHLCSRRQTSICWMTQAAVAVLLWWGVEARSWSPASPWRLHRLTHFEAHAREMPISAATCAIGRVRPPIHEPASTFKAQRSISVRHLAASTFRTRGAIMRSVGSITRSARAVSAVAAHTGPRLLELSSATAPSAGPAAAPMLRAAVA